MNHSMSLSIASPQPGTMRRIVSHVSERDFGIGVLPAQSQRCRRSPLNHTISRHQHARHMSMAEGESRSETVEEIPGFVSEIHFYPSGDDPRMKFGRQPDGILFRRDEETGAGPIHPIEECFDISGCVAVMVGKGETQGRGQSPPASRDREKGIGIGRIPAKATRRAGGRERAEGSHAHPEPAPQCGKAMVAAKYGLSRKHLRQPGARSRAAASLFSARVRDDGVRPAEVFHRFPRRGAKGKKESVAEGIFRVQQDQVQVPSESDVAEIRPSRSRTRAPDARMAAMPEIPPGRVRPRRGHPGYFRAMMTGSSPKRGYLRGWLSPLGAPGRFSRRCVRIRGSGWRLEGRVPASLAASRSVRGVFPAPARGKITDADDEEPEENASAGGLAACCYPNPAA